MSQTDLVFSGLSSEDKIVNHWQRAMGGRNFDVSYMKVELPDGRVIESASYEEKQGVQQMDKMDRLEDKFPFKNTVDFRLDGVSFLGKEVNDPERVSLIESHAVTAIVNEKYYRVEITMYKVDFENGGEAIIPRTNIIGVGRDSVTFDFPYSGLNHDHFSTITEMLAI